MPSSLRWPDAALAGLACSSRSMSGPAVLAARGEISGRARIALLIAGAGELAGDKAPKAPNRTSPSALAGRVASGAYTGHAVGGPIGAAVAAISAGAGSYSTWRIRGLVGAATHLPDPVVGAAEDIISYAAAAAATRAIGESEPRDAVAVAQVASAVGGSTRVPSLLENARAGLVAGLVGTATMTVAQGAEFVLTRAQPSDAPAHVGDQVSRKLGVGRIKRPKRAKANQGMHWLYGSAWGIPYGIVAASAKTRPELTGPAFGLIVWGVGLAQQPAVGVTDPPWKRSLQSLGSEALLHVLYGIGAGAALRVMRNT